MPPLASEGVMQVVQAALDGSLDLTNVVQVVGCLVFFIGFSFVVCKMCCGPPSSTSDDQSSPGCLHKHQYPPARFGRTSPTAPMPKCLACQKTDAHTTVDKSARVAQQSPPRLTRPATPYSPGMRGPMGGGPCPQSCRPAQAPSSHPLNTTPTTPRSPQLGYGARRPTASLRPVVW